VRSVEERPKVKRRPNPRAGRIGAEKGKKKTPGTGRLSEDPVRSVFSQREETGEEPEIAYAKKRLPATCGRRDAVLTTQSVRDSKLL